MTDAQRASLDRAKEMLSEHFDIGQISLTWEHEETKQTHATYLGWGNLYARIGQLQELICSNLEVSADITDSEDDDD